MKDTGIIRKVDDLGRIVLPMELRRTLEISPETPLEIFVDGLNIVLAKYQPGCALCGSSGTKLVAEIAGKWLCRPCVEKAVAALKEAGYHG